MALTCHSDDAGCSLPPMWFRRTDEVYTAAGYTMFKIQHGWMISDPAKLPLYVALTAALHPCSIFEHEGWIDMTYKSFAIRFTAEDIDGGRDDPVDLRDIGLDYFSRRFSGKSVMWFTVQGRRSHSGSKPNKHNGYTHGKRWCSACSKLVSANNYTHQHLPAHDHELFASLRIFPEEL